MREDPEWFVVLGLPGNLLASIGFIMAALVGWRSRRIPGWAALLLGRPRRRAGSSPSSSLHSDADTLEDSRLGSRDETRS